MQISGLTDKPITSNVSTARTQPKDFSENLQKAMNAAQNTQPASSLPAEGLLGFMDSLQASSCLASQREVNAALLSQKSSDTQDAEKAAQTKFEETAAALQTQPEEKVRPEDAANEGAPINDNEQQQQQQNAQQEEENKEPETTPVDADGQNGITTQSPATSGADDVPNSLDELPEINIIPYTGTTFPDSYVAQAQSGTSMDYSQIKEMLLLFCMMMMNSGGDSSNEMQGIMMMAMMNYIGNLDTLRSDVLQTGSAQGIEEWALDRMESEIFGNTENYPSRRGRACTPLITSDVNSRSAAQYNQVIQQFDVENRDRYQNTSSSTWCNIYLWDVTSAMGAEIPHYIDPITSAPRTYPDVSGAKELNANATFNWLKQHGPTYGWIEVNAETAQYYANSGRPAVTAWKNPNSGRSGHVQIVCPSREGTYNSEKGVTVSQAGSRLRQYTYISEIYGSNALKNISYFVHA